VSGPWRNGRLCAIAAIVLLVAPAVAHADLVLEPGNTTLELVDAAGQPDNRAGVHPDRLIQTFKLSDTGGEPEAIRDMIIELPPGLVGDANAVPLCRRSEIFTSDRTCSANTRVGTMRTTVEVLPIYSLQPAPDEAAAFATNAGLAPMVLSGRLRTEDQGLSLYVTNVEGTTIGDVGQEKGQIELWGIPADHQTGTSIPRRALLTTPTRCDIPPLAVTVKIRTWQQPDRWLSGTGDTGHQLTGCGELSFAPSLDFSIDDHRADAPTGARIDVVVPQEENPDARATSLVRDVSIAMPAGVTVSPGGAAGLSACSDAQFGLGGGGDPACPASSRVGSTELDATALGKPMAGAIYLGQERPGERFRLLIAATAGGSVVKFVGSLQADPQTGRLTTNLRDLPQAAFGRMSLRFDGGPGALLATPLACGPAATSAKFTPYNGGPAVDWTGSVSVNAPGGGACVSPAPFAPTFSGGSTNARAGRPTSFTTTVRRQDGEQLPQGLSIALPPGVSAALGTVDPCTSSQTAGASCPTASRIGKAMAELGPGGSPARMEGGVYLTGPYRRAPFGVAFVLKGAIGPLELSPLVVRGALEVNLLSGRVKVAMDSLPTIFEGVPIRFQTIGLDLDRPGFIRNPTSCAPTRVTASLRSEGGALATPSSPFALHGCIDLPFRPDFSVALGGDKQLHEGGKPGLRMSMQNAIGNANLRSVKVLLPRLLKLDSSGLKELCARRRAMNGDCPRSAQIGTATARTPLLERPMSGFLYVVQPKGNGSPDLWAALAGEGLEVNLRGETAVHEGQTETRFVSLPDFPLRSLDLELAGGEGGILKLKRDPCGRLFAPTEIAGQNAARTTVRARVAVQSSCKRDG
jgi:hypothetical protein